MFADNAIVSIVKKALPSVVSIAVAQEIKDAEFPLSSILVSGGSGFIVDETGLILTNRHIVPDHSVEYVIVLQSGQKIMCEIKATDPLRDIAVLKINPRAVLSQESLLALSLGNSQKAQLGETVVAIGNALGMFQNTVSVGVVSGLSREIYAQNELTTERTKLRGLIQTDAAINPGNSGGPLLNIQGRVIGINAAIVSGAQNIGFALPINNGKDILDDLKKYGRIRQPYFGVRYLTIDNEIKRNFGLPVNYGVLVVSEPDMAKGKKTAVAWGSPAQKAGLKDKDIILEIQKQKITAERNINDILDDCFIGKPLPIKILRNGREKILKIVLEERK